MGSESDGAASGPAPTSTPASDPAPSLVDWDLARKVAAGALILKPAPATYRTAPLQSQFDELTARAEFLVTQSTGFKSAHGAARAKVVDRSGWATANVRSMQRLVGSALTVRETDKGPRLGKHALAVGQVATGTQLGLMLAYMATRVLGQYDLLISEEDPADQDPRLLCRTECDGHRGALRLRPQRVPPLVGAARGDPPHAVHGRALVA